MVSSKHTYASRVLSILATMKEVLHFNSQTSTAKAADIAQADTAVRALSGGVEPAAEVAGSKGSSGVWTMTPGAETFRPAVTVTTSSPQACSPTDRASAIAGNGTTSAVITMADCASRRPFCRPDEAVPIHAGLEQRSADHSSDRPPPSRVASTKQAQHPRGYPEDAGKHSNGGHLNGGSLDAPQVELAPGLSTSATRPNAPMVLVMYRSEFPPPRDWRGNIEAAAVTVSGGARISFMEIGEMVSEFSPADCTRGQGLKEEETCRREVLKARLSQLVAGETAGNSEYPCRVRCLSFTYLPWRPSPPACEWVVYIFTQLVSTNRTTYFDSPVPLCHRTLGRRPPRHFWGGHSWQIGRYRSA